MIMCVWLRHSQSIGIEVKADRELSATGPFPSSRNLLQSLVQGWSRPEDHCRVRVFSYTLSRKSLTLLDHLLLSSIPPYFPPRFDENSTIVWWYRGQPAQAEPSNNPIGQPGKLLARSNSKSFELTTSFVRNSWSRRFDRHDLGCRSPARGYESNKGCHH